MAKFVLFLKKLGVAVLAASIVGMLVAAILFKQAPAIFGLVIITAALVMTVKVATVLSFIASCIALFFGEQIKEKATVAKTATEEAIRRWKNTPPTTAPNESK